MDNITAPVIPATRPTLADAIAHAKECFASFDAASPGVEALEHAWFADRENAGKAAARQDGLDRLGVMSQASGDAIHAVIAAPILSLVDMRTKAQYLTDVKGFYFDEPAFHALLANMARDAQPVDAQVVPDPLAELVEGYRKGLAIFSASPLENTEEEDEAIASATWRPLYDQLCTTPPAATTLAGAIAAVRLVLWEQETCGHHEGFTTNTLRAALAYFDEEGVR